MSSRIAAVNEAQAFELPVGWEVKRSLIPGITIDAEDTQDRDDAIWLTEKDEGPEARISISDVGTFIDPRSAIADYAEQRGETLYASRSTTRMIPRRISEGLLSLLDGQETPALSVSLILSQHGEVGEAKFSQDRINPRQMTYEQADDLVMGKGESDDINALRVYKQLALRLLEQRISKGAFAFYNPESGFMTNEEGVLVPIQSDSRSSGQLIVQEFMIMANSAVAEYMSANEVPGLFRNHAMSEDISIDEALEMMASGLEGRITALQKGFGRARYSTIATGHAALRLDAYMHWTSPLRRFADFVNHANLTAHLSEKEYPYPHHSLARIAQHLNKVQNARKKKQQERIGNQGKEERRAAAAKRLGSAATELVQLPPRDFRRVVKVAAERGSVPEELVAAIREQMEQNVITDDRLAYLIFSDHRSSQEWKNVNSLIAGYIRDDPNRTAAILDTAVQSGRIENLQYDTTGKLQQGFDCTARLVLSDSSEVTALAHGTTIKAAKRQANVDLISKVVGQEKATTASESQAVIDLSSVDFPQQFLESFSMQAGGSKPKYSTDKVLRKGKNSAWRSKVTIEKDGETYVFTAEASRKKEAEKNAVIAAIQQLPITVELHEEVHARQVSKNPINVLHERNLAAALPGPEYAFEQVGPSHAPVITCVIRVLTPQGRVRKYRATATSKAQAKTLAAQTAVQEIWGESPEEGTE